MFHGRMLRRQPIVRVPFGVNGGARRGAGASGVRITLQYRVSNLGALRGGEDAVSC